ncbi:MAG: DnaJ domain-containing protein, partial [Desulfomonile tiedjei]|nr:DnaJ domain-containing protein [Desulfomonile tiedjei]
VFRQIERELSDCVLVHHRENGVWIVNVDPEKCLGMDWHGEVKGGYRQCAKWPQFPDSRCYEHSEWESPEMVAFKRNIDCLVSPCEPSAFLLGQLTLTVVEEMIDRLHKIAPVTLKDDSNRRRFQTMLKSALAFLRWKDLIRRRRAEQRIPPEFFNRHRTASSRPMEFSLKNHFIILEVPPTSTKEEVLKAWRRLARRHHPDAEEGDEEKMKQLNDAKDRIFRIKRWN